MKPEKLVMMANQIGVFFASQKGDAAVQDILDHIKKFLGPENARGDPCSSGRGRKGFGPQSAQRHRTAYPTSKGKL